MWQQNTATRSKTETCFFFTWWRVEQFGKLSNKKERKKNTRSNEKI